MKKIISLCLITAFLLGSLYTGTTTTEAATAASDNSAVTEIHYLENGDYIETTITSTPALPSDVMTMATKKWTTNTKTNRYKNSAGDVLWTAAVRGTFWYDGSSSACTYDLAIATAPASTWSIKSKSSSRSGNTATAKVTATQSTSIASMDYTTTITLKCSKTGVVS